MDELSTNQLPHIPNEIYCQIFSSLDLSAIRRVREVSKLWKVLVPRAHPSLHFVCHLTDDTFKFAINSDEMFSRLEVHNFSGKGNEIVSSTTGTGFLFGNTDTIKFIGDNIEPGEIPKMMHFAIDSLKMLEFKNCGIDTLRPFTQAKQTFNAVKELSITYKQFPKANDISALEGLATPELGPLLPSLNRLKILLDQPDYNTHPSCQLIISNYLAIGKLITKYRKSLKDIEIKRTPKLRTITSWSMENPDDEDDDEEGGGGFRLSATQTEQLRQYLEAFQEMTLDKLYISPENAAHPFVLDTQLLTRQQHLKEVIIDHTVVMIDDLPNLDTWLPTNRTSLTSVKITLELYRDGNGGAMNLEAFRGCPNLKILWLEIFHETDDNDRQIWVSSLRFSNVEALPKTISSLRLKCDNQDVENRHWKHQLFILSPEQITWIINNLRDLESLWVQLVLTPKRSGDGRGPQPIAQQNVNRRPNITLQTFDDVLSLPKLSDLKLDVFKVKQLQASFDGDEEDVVEDKEFDAFVVSLGEIQDYVDACKNIQRVSSVSQYPVQGKALRFWELTIHTSSST